MPAEPFIGEIYMFAGTYAPKDYAFCNGSLMPIAQNYALFSILGNNYGGDGITTFALPDLRGRFPIHCGNSQGPGLTARSLAEKGGAETVALAPGEMPAHVHSLQANKDGGTMADPEGNFPAGDGAGNALGYATSANAAMSSTAIGSAGGGAAHENMPPFLGVNFIIALYGVFPMRS